MIEYWWPTEIGFYDNPEHDKLNLVDYCYEVQSKTESGGKDWISSDTYNTSNRKFQPHKDEKFKKLDGWIKEQIKNYITETNLAYEITEEQTDSWFNIYKKGDFQEIHDHLSYVLSAVYFLKSNPEFSPLTFRPNFLDHLAIGKTQGLCTNCNVNYSATPGRLVVFRSYLPHCVEKHKDNEDRISIAYNMR